MGYFRSIESLITTHSSGSGPMISDQSGHLQLKWNDKKYKIDLLNTKKCSKENLQSISSIFNQMENQIDWNRGEIEKIKLTKSEGDSFQVEIIQKDKNHAIEVATTLNINEPSLNKLELPKGHMGDGKSIEVSVIKESVLPTALLYLFDKIIYLIFGETHPVSLEIVKEFESITPLLPESFQKNVYKNLSRMSPEEIQWLDSMRSLIKGCTSESESQKGEYYQAMAHILKGAYVIIVDDGKNYDEWSKLKGCKQRISSHESHGAKQYGFNGKFLKECLFSTKNWVDEKSKASKNVTWFQFERHGTSFSDISSHASDYVEYRITKKNIGPYGSSEFREDANELVLRLK